MPNLAATLAVMDGTATPVSVTYSLEEKSDGGALYVDRRLATRDLQPEIVLGFKRPSAKARTYNCTRNVKLPIVRVVNGVDTVVGYNKGFVSFVIDKASNEQERAHLFAAADNVTGLADSKTQVLKLEAWN